MATESSLTALAAMKEIREALAALVTERETLGERQPHMVSVWDVLETVEEIERRAHV
jgi:hypothetical protein